jgi:hypothetical protein
MKTVRRIRGESPASKNLSPGEFHGVSEHLNACSFLRQILSCPAGMLRAEEVSFGMRHESEDAAAGIADAGDAVHRAVGVEGIGTVGSAFGIAVLNDDLSIVRELVADGFAGGDELPFAVADG